uniref:NADH-ubiquinone oxidoreductase chain 6 n=1 Tax=Plautia fimbriata TaxID=286708 RepID=A0A4D6X198_9HEMI|nr:NADH dehydrogenase subunit 6 [Plautia fimbriata]QCI09426.1 NADH dehydrogenase subunit 6 [Plautia fimbriata]
MNLMMSLMINMALILMMLNHPLSMGLILIMQTLITAMLIGYMMNSFLFSYIIIIIMLSGALVLFIYMASIASNEKFNLSIKNLLLSAIMLSVSLLWFFLYNKMTFSNNMIYIEELSLIKLFNTNTAKITLLMIIYLLLAMIAVSNIVKTNNGPLRMSSNYE